MPNIRWQDLSDIKHAILNDLQQVVKIERAGDLQEAIIHAVNLKNRLMGRMDNLNGIINRIPDDERNGRGNNAELEKDI